MRRPEERDLHREETRASARRSSAARYSLIIIHRGADYARDFREIAEKIALREPAIATHALAADARELPADVWTRPCYAVALTDRFRLEIRRGPVLRNRPIDKLVQLRMAAAAGIAVPPAKRFAFGMWLDPVLFGEFVIIKPRDPALTSSGRGIQLFRRRHLESLRPEDFPRDHPIFRDRLGYMVQRYIDPGPLPTFDRVLTFLGRPIYEASGHRTTPRPDLTASDGELASAQITIQGGPIERRWGVAPDMRDMAVRVGQAFRDVPLLAIDLIRDRRSGRPYFLECNPGGNTWHFSSRQSGGMKIRMILGEAEKHGKAAALELGRLRMIEQTGAFDIIAEALIEETLAHAG